MDGQAVDFSAILLRDSCQCPRCVHESTNQRLFSVADIPSNIKPRTVQVDASSDSVRITWQNDAAGYTPDHTTKLGLDALRNIKSSGAYSGSRRESFTPHALWSTEPLNLEDYDYNTYMKDDGALYALMEQLRTCGLAFVKNSPGLEETLATIATRIGPIKDTFYGYTWDGKCLEKPSSIPSQWTKRTMQFAPFPPLLMLRTRPATWASTRTFSTSPSRRISSSFTAFNRLLPAVQVCLRTLIKRRSTYSIKTLMRSRPSRPFR